MDYSTTILEEPAHLPEKWSEWKLSDIIGRGSYGTVWRAKRKLNDQILECAIKIISVPAESENTDPIVQQIGSMEAAYEYYHDIVSEFEDEIQMMDRLKGLTNVVSIEDYAVEKRTDRIGWTIYLRMEYLTSFIDYQAQNLLDEKDVIRLGLDISSALIACRRENIIHRDIKPGNIFVSKHGDFKLGDFGISRTFERTVGSYTRTGTSAYMAPEVMHNEQYEATADQYSLGLVMYELMNDNRAPFLDPGMQIVSFRKREEALLKRFSGEKLPPPKNASPAFSSIILKCCEFRSADRYADADHLHDALIRLQSGQAPEEEVPVNKKKNREYDRILIPLVIAVVIIAVLFLYLNRDKFPHKIIPETATEAATEYNTETETAELDLNETESKDIPNKSTLQTERAETSADASSATPSPVKIPMETEATKPVLYTQLSRFGNDKNCYFISQDGQWGLYLDDKTISIEALQDGTGNPKDFHGSSDYIITGRNYEDDGTVINFTNNLERKTISVYYSYHDDGIYEGKPVLEAIIGNLDRRLFDQTFSANYFGGVIEKQ